MALSQFMAAINQIADEKSLDAKTVINAVEQAIAAAYRKDYGKPRQLINASWDKKTGRFSLYQVLNVVEEVENEEQEINLKSAAMFKKNAKIGDEIHIPLPYHDEFGRIAAQTAKQVIIQRLKEAERNVIFSEYKDKEGQILPGTVQQIEGRTVVVNLGKSNALMLPSDQTRNEQYYIGQRFRVYIKAVEESARGPRILVSRSDPNLISGLFTLEVPEIQAGTVEIKSVAREAGYRSKVAVAAANKTIDPVGSCVGQRGTRIQAILAELGDEKIDIVLWDKNPAQFIANSLSPAKIEEVHYDEKNKKATVFVKEDQLSLSIGKNGQNVRLAGNLTDYEIDVKPLSEKNKADSKEKDKGEKTKTPKTEEKEIEPDKKKAAAKKGAEKSDKGDAKSDKGAGKSDKGADKSDKKKKANKAVKK